jgi:hypothetical protein
MSRWETTSTLEAGVSPASIWEKAYADAAAWPKWNAEIKRAQLDGPLALGASAKIVFGTGLRLRFAVVEFEDGRLFTDESRLPGARLGHRQHHLHRGLAGAPVASGYGTGRGTNPAGRSARGGGSGKNRLGSRRLERFLSANNLLVDQGHSHSCRLGI